MTGTAAIVEERLRVHGDVHDHEIAEFVRHCTNLDARLKSFRPDSVALDLFVKDRETPNQHVTLKATIAHWPILVATADDEDLERALFHVRDEMVRLVSDEKEKRNPRNDRR